LTTREAIILSSADRPWGRGPIPLAKIVRSDMSGKRRDFQNFDIKGVREANADLEALVIQLE
jgi:hypothetical protein